jgi:hypothetical protein
MSFLYPLFLAGVAAMGLPILLHMIRRHTRKRVTFSSLMFLRATMPRFRSRSNLEHVPLLILRCLVLCLLAFAFARPFLLRPAASNPAGAGSRVVLLLDTSASMRRAGMWSQAVEEAKAALANAGPADHVCVMSFDRGARTRIGFEQWAALDPARRASAVTEELSQLSPGWASTDLGHALIAAAEALEDDEINDGQQAPGPRRIVLISDLQQGSNLEALRTYEWPQGTELAVEAISCQGATNASLQLVTSRDYLAPSRGEDSTHIRITNSPDAANDHFQLRWAVDQPPPAGSTPEGGGATSDQAIDVYAAPGHSTVVPAPVRTNPQGTTKLVLTGDDHDFDNSLYVMPGLRQQANILYLGGDDPNDAAGMLYYLRQAFEGGKAPTARVLRRSAGDSLGAADIEAAHLIVVTDALGPQNVAPLRRYLESGRSLLVVVKSAEVAASLSNLAGLGGLESQEAETNRYAMLGRLEFDHPLLKPFSDPRFGDFTRIHFWKYRRIDVSNHPEARVLARFDNNDPAWFEIPVGQGSLLVWTSGWHPADSDLALSSKFVPLLYCVLEYGGAVIEHPSQYFVGDPVPNRVSFGATDIEIRKPDGAIVRLDTARPSFTETDLPGIYTMADHVLASAARQSGSSGSSRNPQSFAMNLPAAESRTDPMPLEDLEKLGVSLGPAAGVRAESASTNPQTAIRNPQSKHEFWRWVLAATMVMLLLETWLGGWLTPGKVGFSPPDTSGGASPTLQAQEEST